MLTPIMFLNSITLFLRINNSVSVNAIELTQYLNNGSYPNFYLSMVQSTDRGPASPDRFIRPGSFVRSPLSVLTLSTKFVTFQLPLHPLFITSLLFNKNKSARLKVVLARWLCVMANYPAHAHSRQPKKRVCLE
jgi:hypothetical protein